MDEINEIIKKCRTDDFSMHFDLFLNAVKKFNELELYEDENPDYVLYVLDHEYDMVSYIVFSDYDDALYINVSITDDGYSGKQYNRLLRIIMIIFALNTNMKYIISLAVSPTSAYIMKSMGFKYKIDEDGYVGNPYETFDVVYDFIGYLDDPNLIKRVNGSFKNIFSGRNNSLCEEGFTEISNILSTNMSITYE
jgi:hypothetical protein